MIIWARPHSAFGECHGHCLAVFVDDYAKTTMTSETIVDDPHEAICGQRQCGAEDLKVTSSSPAHAADVSPLRTERGR